VQTTGNRIRNVVCTLVAVIAIDGSPRDAHPLLAEIIDSRGIAIGAHARDIVVDATAGWMAEIVGTDIIIVTGFGLAA
jgi:hypothetical protein